MKRHDSMRGYFAYELYKAIAKDKRIILITGDLGYGMFNQIREQFPNQFINTGAAEQAMMGLAVGLALEGKIPFVYSITTFLLYRPYETIRNYLDHENINVKLIGSGRDKDYAHDGFSHWSNDAKKVLNNFIEIKAHWPTDKEQIPSLLQSMVRNNYPEFLSLKRG